MEDLFFEIKESGSFLRLLPGKSQSHGFIKTHIEIKAGVFSGNYEAEFQLWDYNYLSEKFSYIYDNLDANFDFQNLERDLELKISGDGTGHFNVVVSAYDAKRFPNENSLKFELFIDQTYIKDYIYQLGKIIKAYS